VETIAPINAINRVHITNLILASDAKLSVIGADNSSIGERIAMPKSLFSATHDQYVFAGPKLTPRADPILTPYLS
jgi:hypothetical protein